MKQQYEQKKTPIEKLDMFLLYIYNRSSQIGAKQFLVRDSPDWNDAMAKSYASSDDELKNIIKMTSDLGYISYELNSGILHGIYSVIIKYKGLHRIAELKRGPKQSSLQCFVSMHLNDDTREIYENGIKIAIQSAGYYPFLIDTEENIKKIDDAIIMEIRRSLFMVADFTVNRAELYYEAGFAKGLHIPVILCCRDKDMPNLHFDTRQCNCLTWEEDKIEKFRTHLQQRIEAELGHGSRRDRAFDVF